MKKSFNIQKLLHRKSKHHETKPMHLLERAFQRDLRIWFEAFQFGEYHKYKQNKTNKIPSFINRFFFIKYQIIPL